MRPLLEYFAAEKQGAMVLLVGGVIGVGAATALTMMRSSYAGAAIPLVALGLLAVGIGAGIWGRTDHQVLWLTDQIRSTAVTAVPAEVSRMQRVRRSLQMALVFEGFVIAAGVVLALASRSTPHVFAAGLGCIGAGALLLTFDLIADRRAALYLAHMVSCTKGLYGS